MKTVKKDENEYIMIDNEAIVDRNPFSFYRIMFGEGRSIFFKVLKCIYGIYGYSKCSNAVVVVKN